MNRLSNATEEWRSYAGLPIAAAFGYSTAVLHTYAMGPFIEPLQHEFGWSRTQASIGITIAGVAGAVLSVPIGMLVDRLGSRRIALVGVLLMSASIALLGTATGGLTNWLILWSIVAFGNLWLQATVWTRAVASRFEYSRGFAFAITMSGASVAAAIHPILSTWLIDVYGWRTGFVALGGIWAAVVFPVVFIFFREARDETAEQSPANVVSSVELAGMTVSEGLRSSTFYKLLFASGALSFTVLGIIVHFVPILRASGVVPLAAASTASLVGIFSLIGRLGTGFLLDRFSARLVGSVIFLLSIGAAALLIVGSVNPISQGTAAALFGLTVGAEVDVIAYLAARYFGLKSFGTLFGAMVGALALGTALGPLAASVAFDHYGGYEQFLLLTIVLMGASSVAVATLGKQRYSSFNEALVDA